MRALRLKAQIERSNAATAIESIIQASAARTKSFDQKDGSAGDPRRRRRANVFIAAPTMTSNLVSRIRLILPHVLLFCTTVLYGILGAICFSYTEQGYETGHMTHYSKNAIAAQVRSFNLSCKCLFGWKSSLLFCHKPSRDRSLP